VNHYILKKFTEKIVDKQQRPCCKYWISLFFEKIRKQMKNTGGGEFKYCPECSKLFKFPSDKEIDDIVEEYKYGNN